MSLAEKHLYMAAYIAASNHKKTDDFILGGKQKGNRRKVQAGHDDPSESSAPNTNSDSSHRARSFNLDRLLAIYAHIAGTCGVEKLGGGARAAIAMGNGKAVTDAGEYMKDQIKTYGDSDLFASVSSLSLLY
jgi:hypothetical protein